MLLLTVTMSFLYSALLSIADIMCLVRKRQLPQAPIKQENVNQADEELLVLEREISERKQRIEELEREQLENIKSP